MPTAESVRDQHIIVRGLRGRHASARMMATDKDPSTTLRHTIPQRPSHSHQLLVDHVQPHPKHVAQTAKPQLERMMPRTNGFSRLCVCIWNLVLLVGGAHKLAVLRPCCEACQRPAGRSSLFVHVGKNQHDNVLVAKKCSESCTVVGWHNHQ